MTGPEVITTAAVVAEYKVDEFFEQHEGHSTRISGRREFSTVIAKLICETCKVYLKISVVTESGGCK